jgi:hypothetical protein
MAIGATLAAAVGMVLCSQAASAAPISPIDLSSAELWRAAPPTFKANSAIRKKTAADNDSAHSIGTVVWRETAPLFLYFSDTTALTGFLDAREFELNIRRQLSDLYRRRRLRLPGQLSASPRRWAGELQRNHARRGSVGGSCAALHRALRLGDGNRGRRRAALSVSVLAAAPVAPPAGRSERRRERDCSSALSRTDSSAV